MRKVTTNIDLDGEVLVDIDVYTDDSYIGITDKENVVFPYGKIEVRQSFRFPFIRQITNDSFLVTDSRTRQRADNCFIYDLKGNVINHFYAGDGVEDIEVVHDRIIVTYFDEGVFGAKGPNNEGLVLFDINGKILFKYNEKHGEQIIFDCYCICKHGNNKVVFLPYTGFPLIELDLDTGDEEKYEIPEELMGSNGLTTTDESILFHSPYDDKRGIYKWRRGDKTANKVADYSEGLRGLKNGRFISIGEKGFTILDLNKKHGGIESYTNGG